MAVVNDPASPTNDQATARPLRACALALTGTVVVLFMLLGPVGYWYYGWAGVAAVAAAGLLCLLAGLLATLVSRNFQLHGQAISGVLVAMGIRMGIPLAVCLLLAVRGSADSLAGFVYYLLVFYLATLGVETWYSLPAGAALRPSSGRE